MNTLRVIRLGKGLSQEAVAMDLNITTSAYSKIERGETNVSLDRVLQILDSLAVSFSEMLYAEEMIARGTRKGQVAESIIPQRYSMAALTQEKKEIEEENARLVSLLKLKDGLLKLYCGDELEQIKQEQNASRAAREGR